MEKQPDEQQVEPAREQELQLAPGRRVPSVKCILDLHRTKLSSSPFIFSFPGSGLKPYVAPTLPASLPESAAAAALPSSSSPAKYELGMLKVQFTQKGGCFSKLLLVTPHHQHAHRAQLALCT